MEPDPNFEEELRRARISIAGWETDFSRHSVPFSEILSGGVPRDGYATTLGFPASCATVT